MIVEHHFHIRQSSRHSRNCQIAERTQIVDKEQIGLFVDDSLFQPANKKQMLINTSVCQRRLQSHHFDTFVVDIQPTIGLHNSAIAILTNVGRCNNCHLMSKAMLIFRQKVFLIDNLFVISRTYANVNDFHNLSPLQSSIYQVTTVATRNYFTTSLVDAAHQFVDTRHVHIIADRFVFCRKESRQWQTDITEADNTYFGLFIHNPRRI